MEDQLKGYHPSDVFDTLGSEIPKSALFTTFTFSPGAFQQQYLTPLTVRGCGDIAVLTDALGYAQSLSAAAAVQGIGTDYRLRSISLSGAFHAKLVLLRLSRAVIVGVGSGNLTVPGLLTNAEVGALYRVEDIDTVVRVDNLISRLRIMAGLETQQSSTAVEPIAFTPDTRLLTSLDAPIFEQLHLPDDVQRIEVVTPFVDGQLQAFGMLRSLWPHTPIRLRIDPLYGAVTSSLMSLIGPGIELQVPVERPEDTTPQRPHVHGKFISFLGSKSATVLLGSANLSEPALLTHTNFEAVIERRLPTHLAERLTSVPHIEWRDATTADRTTTTSISLLATTRPLTASISHNQFHLQWKRQNSIDGILRVWCRGRCIYEDLLTDVQTDENGCWCSLQLDQDTRDQIVTSCHAELQLANGTGLRGWIDDQDRLDVPPEARQLHAYIQEVASDPAGCEEDQVIRFIAQLRRSLASPTSTTPRSNFGSSASEPEEYDETLIRRRDLVESSASDRFHQLDLLNRFANRTLDGAIRELRFFARDVPSKAAKDTTDVSAADPSVEPRDEVDRVSVPPKVEQVLRQLFEQLAEALDSSLTPRSTSHLISRIPTCIKALAYAFERWLPRNDAQHLLPAYFQPVVFASLAPGVASTLCRIGAIRRLSTTDRPSLGGFAEFELGIALLEAHVCFQYHLQRYSRVDVLRDLLDVLAEVPQPPPEVLQNAGEELWRLEASSLDGLPCIQSIRDKLRHVPGEIAALRDTRSALSELLSVVANPQSDATNLKSLVERLAGDDPTKRQQLDTYILSSRSRLRLLEIESDAEACPNCYTVMPTAVRSRLADATFLHKCSSCSCSTLICRFSSLICS